MMNTTLMSPISGDSGLAARQHTTTFDTLSLSEIDSYRDPSSSQLALHPVAMDDMVLNSAFLAEETPTVGLIDAGFDTDLINMDPTQLIVGTDYLGPDQPDDLHGTALANIVSTYTDTAPGLWLSNTVGSGKWADALVEFVDAAKHSGQEQAIANLSFDLVKPDAKGGLKPRQTLTENELAALTYAQDNNVIVVAAAGNDGATIGALGSASDTFDNVITVGAAEGTALADYSNYGSSLDVLAPGGSGDRPIDNGIDGYDLYGTSVAASIASASIAEIWEENPDLSYRQVLDILQTTATDLYAPGDDIYSGAGLINLDDALQQAQSTIPDPTAPEPASTASVQWAWDGDESPIGVERPLMANAPTLGKGTSGRIEAESFSLDGYKGDRIGSISSIAVTKDKGTAAAKFGGETGLYTLRVLYYEENDGKASFDLKVGNKTYRWTADGASKYNYPTPNNGVVREFKNVLLTKGSTIELTGNKDGGERARVDYVEFEQSGAATAAPAPTPSQPSGSNGSSGSPAPFPAQPSPSPNPSPTPSDLPFTLQAESFNLSGFVIENDSDAAGNKLIKTSNKGTARTKFTGQTGTYNVAVNYFDERDGRSPFSFKAGGQSFDWVANKSLNGNVATKDNRTRQTFKGLTLSKGSTIELGGQRQAGEFARIDSVRFTPVTTAAPNPSSAALPPPILLRHHPFLARNLFLDRSPPPLPAR